MMHPQTELSHLATTLLQSVTSNAAHALGLSCGILKQGCYSDFIVTTLPQACECDDVALQLILHTHQTHLTFIDGEKQC
jgi:imidazolonepropionase-like amidohydrolase